ncbi:MAG: acyltransferase [Oscillospiraceae bacterium]|jgi:fucose 4-O-acetylase-like acetyltransferase|nr:acyltransferase [Oscillospiraceae bacterium]
MDKKKSEAPQKREIWTDNIKIFACVLVVLGHFFQSMIKSEILPDSGLYQWFNQTIYYFHVPLFFICSGYLYQKNSCINSFSAWKNNALKKALALCIPYFVFSLITWSLKTLFSGAVNNEVSGLFHSLFIEPIAPYWYLYCLFFIFLVTPTFSTNGMAVIGLAIALTAKAIGIWGENISVYAVSQVFANEIWFVLGMCFGVFNIIKFSKSKTYAVTGVSLAIVFLGVSIWKFEQNINFKGFDFLLGLAACASVVLLFSFIFQRNIRQKFLCFLSQYTMPIFLMHTIFAAPLRSILLKFGIVNAGIHITIGLFASFGGPIVAAMVMHRFKWLDFLIYPGNHIKFKKTRTQQ